MSYETNDPRPGSHSRDPEGSAVSVLGVGMLGAAVSRALLRVGHEVTVWNRTDHKAKALAAEGAGIAATPADAVSASRLVIAAVSTYDDVRTVLARDVGGLAGRTLVNLSSGTPDEARALAAWAGDHGVRYLDGAAMSGVRLVGEPVALFLYSGDTDAFAAHETRLAALGRAVHLGSDAGVASLYDTALLTMNMGVLSGFYQGVALVGAAGIGAPAFASVVVDYLPFVTGLVSAHASQIDERRYPADEGTLEVLAAAMRHVVETGRRHGIDVEVAATIERLFERGIAAGYGDDGVARLADVIARR